MSDPERKGSAFSVTFDCSMNTCGPSTISAALDLSPDGSMFCMPPALSYWWLFSDLISDDPVHHLQFLLEQLEGREDRIDPAWNPQFTVVWTGADDLPEKGQVYPPDVLAGIARCKAELKIEVAKPKTPPAPSG